MVTVRLPADMEEKLNKITEATRRPKSFYIKEALERYLDEMEDFYIALDRLSQPGSKYYTTEEVKKELDL
jgi:RHH-type transcriptional regulator, rel operon repressor / antitoxin RelB